MKPPRAQSRPSQSRSRRRSALAAGPAVARGRPPRVGGRGGARLASAFEAVECFPVLAEARRRAFALARRVDLPVARLAPVVESDVGLTITVLRAANQRAGAGFGSVPAALDALGPAALSRLLKSVVVYDFLDPAGPWGPVPEATRRHAVATRIAVERVAEIAKLPARDELGTAALLHDVGRLVLLCLYDEYEERISPTAMDSEERLRSERRELGIDHALVGGVLARRLGLPDRVTAAIERHHAVDATRADAAVGLADLVAHHVHGDPIPADLCRSRANALGLSPADLRSLLYEFPYQRAERPVSTEPCPLSARELDALRGLAEGRVYKEIALEMGLSASTIRTHLHNVYGKLGTADRAQAVLMARDRGWV